MAKRALHLLRGDSAEKRARRQLEHAGLRHLESNYRCRFGEIDLIMAQGETLVFVEVRFRHHVQFGGALATVDRSKQGKLLRSASDYLQRHDLFDRPCRFDVVAFSGEEGRDGEWIENAFGLE